MPPIGTTRPVTITASTRAVDAAKKQGGKLEPRGPESEPTTPTMSNLYLATQNGPAYTFASDNTAAQQDTSFLQDILEQCPNEGLSLMLDSPSPGLPISHENGWTMMQLGGALVDADACVEPAFEASRKAASSTSFFNPKGGVDVAGSHLSTAAAAGIGAGVTAAVTLGAALCVYCCCCRRSKSPARDEAPHRYRTRDEAAAHQNVRRPTATYEARRTRAAAPPVVTNPYHGYYN